jgi:hypothetical protein
VGAYFFIPDFVHTVSKPPQVIFPKETLVFIAIETMLLKNNF